MASAKQFGGDMQRIKCQVEHCQRRINDRFFCCHCCRDIMGETLYGQARDAWDARPFDPRKWGEILATVNAHIKTAIEASRAATRS